MLTVGIFIKDATTSEYNRLELFDDEKISVNSSIQNINDISKTYTDFSQTFTVPASKQNNKIFKHWYDNSNDSGFSTLTKADAYIEIDTIRFRTGKIQLESANVENGQPQNYSITFIGALGSLKDKFNGLYLKDLDPNNIYVFDYSPTIVKNKVTTTVTSDVVMFPLISSRDYWTYGSGTYNINSSTTPIRYNELFPALQIYQIINMINNRFGIDLMGSGFLNPYVNPKIKSAYLWLKNSDTFEPKYNFEKVDLISTSGTIYGYSADLTNNKITSTSAPAIVSGKYYNYKRLSFSVINGVSGKPFKVQVYKNGLLFFDSGVQTTVIGVSYISPTIDQTRYNGINDVYEFYFGSLESINYQLSITAFSQYTDLGFVNPTDYYGYITSSSVMTSAYALKYKDYFPDIKIEDFFSGLLKMFNLTCYSTDGYNYTTQTLEDYYTSGNIIDITKYVKSDTIALNRVKTYKKINFEYENSESLVNVGYKSANNIEYGSLFYDTNNDGEEYSIKLPFEDLNFSNLKDKLQVGYALKTDYQKYIPKPVILYDYNPTALTSLTGTTFYFSTTPNGSGTGYTSYKAFGQEYTDGTDTFSLNFNEQQSTLTNDVVTNSLYNQYYQNYLTNIFDSKARLIKVSAILPTSLLTTLKLNDRLVIRDKRYLINTMTTDLTSGEVQFELLTDFRTL
jgi:hypothetical protein